MSLIFSYAGASHVGLVRGNNEDSAYAGPHLLALADGMGGHAAGEIASQIVVTAMSRLDEPQLHEPLEQLEAAMTAGNIAIAEEIETNPETEGMGCTLDALLLSDDALHLCHVGDSRAYRMRDGELTQITRDDTFVQSLVDEGRLDPADASSHPQRSLILKALTGRPVEPTLQTLDVRPGDRYLLCSDGLSDPVSSDTIRDVLKRSPLDEIPNRLVDLALRSGGPDNVTVIVGEVGNADDAGKVGSADAHAAQSDVNSSDASPESPEASDSFREASAGTEPTLSKAGGTSAGAGTTSVPIIVGALDPEVSDQPRPDTAAGRAMNMVVTHRPLPQNAGQNPGHAPVGDAPGITGSGAVAGASSGTGTSETTDTTNSDDQRGDNPKSKSRKPLIITLVILLVAAIAIPWILHNYLRDTYFLAANEHDEIVLYHGTETEPLGITLHWPYQRACLGKKADISLYNADDPKPSDCHTFTLDDLQPAARARVKGLPEGSYDDVQRQLHRLAGSALPLCVTRTKEEPDAAAEKAPSDAPDATAKEDPSAEAAPSTEESAAAEATSAAPAEPAEPTSEASNPGDLTTAGVNCREVK